MEDFNNKPGYSEVNSGNILYQLKEKLKLQAKQLRTLESYKSLCEERIKDLSPFHPLPITKEHIGLKSFFTQEKLGFSRSSDTFPSANWQKVENLSGIEKEKKELEESLRNEMQTSEEQRIFIEVLKQALEVNMENLGFIGAVEDFANFAYLKQGFIKAEKDLEKAAEEIEDLRYQIVEMSAEFECKDQDCKGWMKKFNEIHKEVYELSMSLRNSVGETVKLEEEKSNLIEYIEKITKDQEENYLKVRELKENVERLEGEGRGLGRNYKMEMEIKKKLEIENENLKIELEKSENSLKESQHYFISLKGRVEEKDRNLSRRNEEVAEGKEKVLSMENEIKRLEESLEEIKKERKENVEKNDKFEKKAQETEGLLMETQRDLQKSRERSDYFEGQAKELRVNCEDLSFNLKDLNEKYRKLKNHIEDLNQEFEIQKTMLRDSMEREVSFSSKISDLEAHNFQLTSNLQTLESSNTLLKVNEISLLTENSELKLKFHSLLQEKIHLDQEISHLNSIISIEKANNQFANNEISILRDKIESLTEVVQISNENFSDHSTKLQVVQLENHKLIESLTSFQTSLQEERIEKLLKSEELCKLLLEHNNLSEDYAFLSESFQLANAASIRLLPFFNLANENSLLKNLEKSEIEIEKLIRSLESTSELYKTNKHLLEVETKRCESLAQDLSIIKSKEIAQRSHSDSLKVEITHLRDTFLSQINTLQEEILTSRKSFKSLHAENEVLTEQIRKSTGEINHYRYKVSSSESNAYAFEEKFGLMKNEKGKITSLIKTIQKLFVPSGYQRVLNEILRIYSELEFCQLEKLRVSMQLRRPDEGTSEVFLESLRKQAKMCENNIQSYTNSLYNLESQLTSDQSLT